MYQAEPSDKDLLEEEMESGWIVTYADLMTLLLVFFVLMFAISTLNLERFKKAILSIQISLGEVKSPVELIEPNGSEDVPEEKVRLEALIGLQSRQEIMLRKSECSPGI